MTSSTLYMADVETGSFNFTKGVEEKNAENALVLHDAAIAGTYAQKRERLWREPEERKGALAIYQAVTRCDFGDVPAAASSMGFLRLMGMQSVNYGMGVL